MANPDVCGGMKQNDTQLGKWPDLFLPFFFFFLPFPVVVLLQQMYVVCCAGHFENHYVCNPVECGLCWLSMFSICEDMKLDQRVVSAERKTITCIIQFSTKRAAWRNATPETLESATWSDLHRDHKNKQTGVITLGCRLIAVEQIEYPHVCPVLACTPWKSCPC